MQWPNLCTTDQQKWDLSKGTNFIFHGLISYKIHTLKTNNNEIETNFHGLTSYKLLYTLTTNNYEIDLILHGSFPFLYTVQST